ncbi:glycoside hydrolase family 95 protein [Mucilaginibacter sp. JRF]|uniref:glycoside hydrolase family 95 protein n=1 Tax=Mucilaginibacter sp. JRF TaxID=2780088 RepID=UPI001881FDD6|nr:glycoside hydrolase family 95 protein [Mucilaginibacter sp. JRF]MBE9583451.1 glycoside hydrolase family 95 protein [Mucilaginibacter sp. JRF]
MRIYKRALCFISLTFSLGITTVNAQSLKLWYDKPARVWEETLPLGNGRLGMMPDGGVSNEKIVLNDITLWSGAPQDANNYEAYKYLPEIRRLLDEGKNDEAQALIDKNFVCKAPGSGDVPFGCYQTFGDLNIKFNHGDGKEPQYSNYRRGLSLETAMASTSYIVNGVTYTREYFTGFGTDVSVIRLTTDKKGMLNLSISLSRPERAEVSVNDNTLQMQGGVKSGTDKPGMQFLAKVKAVLKGGTQSAANNTLEIKDADEVTIFISMGTDYKNPAYKNKLNALLDAAIKKPYELQKQQHVAKYQKIYGRLNLTLGQSKQADNLPTNQRLLAFHKDPAADKGLPVLFFQFGRYLSISSTRVGLLPPNLQGLWANQVQTPWNGDYHLDVNVQMNHWPVEVANLSELNLPLADLVEGMIEPGKRTAKAYYNADGWVAHVITNIWGFTEPGESASWGITKAGSGWLCNNLWDHYAFSNDKAYLKKIYLILKGSAQFYSSILTKDKKTGWLVTSPSSSPENSFYLPGGKHASICIGATIDNQIIRELFNNVITASKTLGIDAAFSTQLKEKLKSLPPAVNIAKDGRVMEWLEDYKETDPQHRHISHLYGLYPASLITADGTPKWAEAAKKTLEVRGDDGPSWTIAYKLLFWARLHDGNRAYKLFTEIMKPTERTDINYGAGGGIYPNLLSAGPPFQIDGNLGTTAGIAEMLIQSHEGYINLLPAIPDSWKAEGTARGFKARGNFTVNFTWKDGKVVSYKVTSATPKAVKLKVNGKFITTKSVKA